MSEIGTPPGPPLSPEEQQAHDQRVRVCDVLDAAQAERDWRDRCAFIKVFVEDLVAAHRSLLLSERDALLSRAAKIFRCSTSSLLIDLRRARVEKAEHEIQAEVKDLERLWGLE